jgi:hypothetical protein
MLGASDWVKHSTKGAKPPARARGSDRLWSG